MLPFLLSGHNEANYGSDCKGIAGLVYPVINLKYNLGILFSLKDQEAVGDPVQRQKWIDSLSISSHAHAGDPPQFLCYGDKDSIVPPKGILEYKETLDRIGVPNTILNVHGAGHGFGDCGTDRENHYRQRLYRLMFGRFAYWISSFTEWARHEFEAIGEKQ